MYILFGSNSTYFNIYTGHSAHAVTSSFADGEIITRIPNNVRNEDVYIIQSTSAPVNSNLMELMFLIDAARRSAASRITAVIPYFGYSRQDRKEMSRVPISASVVCKMLQNAGANRIITFDIHSAQIQGFTDIPFDNLYAEKLFVEHIWQTPRSNRMLVAPDEGATRRVRRMANYLSIPVAMIEKRRWAANQSEVMNVIGDPTGKDCILVDDMIDTGGTIIKAARALQDAGAKTVCVYATHPVLSGNALEAMYAAKDTIQKLIVTNTIPIKNAEELKQNGFVEVLDISQLLQRVLEATANGFSVSSIFV